MPSCGCLLCVALLLMLLSSKFTRLRDCRTFSLAILRTVVVEFDPLYYSFRSYLPSRLCSSFRLLLTLLLVVHITGIIIPSAYRPCLLWLFFITKQIIVITRRACLTVSIRFFIVSYGIFFPLFTCPSCSCSSSSSSFYSYRYSYSLSLSRDRGIDT